MIKVVTSQKSTSYDFIREMYWIITGHLQNRRVIRESSQMQSPNTSAILACVLRNRAGLIGENAAYFITLLSSDPDLLIQEALPQDLEEIQYNTPLNMIDDWFFFTLSTISAILQFFSLLPKNRRSRDFFPFGNFRKWYNDNSSARYQQIFHKKVFKSFWAHAVMTYFRSKMSYEASFKRKF